MKSKLTYANVVATLALVVAVAGGSTAIAISAKPAKNSVTSASIRDGGITGRDLARVRVELASNPNAGGGARVRAKCRRGEQLLGGGTTGQEFDSIPDGNAWSASGPNFIRAHALCLSAKPGR